MRIEMMVNSSDDRAFNKNLSTVATLTGSLRQGSSIMEPVFLIEGNASTLAGCNYMHVSEFNRYFFITDLTSVRNSIMQVSGRVDVLTTYKDSILANTGVIARQENAWNLYLDDGAFKVYNNPIILTRAFPSGFSSMSFILAVAGS